MKTIEEVRKDMVGYGAWGVGKWMNYLKQLSEEVRAQAFDDMKTGVIVR